MANLAKLSTPNSEVHFFPMCHPAYQSTEGGHCVVQVE